MSKQYFYDTAELFKKFIDQFDDDLDYITHLVVQTLSNGNTVFHAGNGWSAADAQHFDAELVGTFYNKSRKWLRSEALTTNTSTLTAVANDLGYDQIFARQLEAKAKPGDIIFLFSTSGNSKNCLIALRKAKEMWVTTIWLLGNDGGAMKELCDYKLVVPSNDTPKIQQVHEAIFHSICIHVDKQFG